MAVAALLVTKEIARYRPALYRLALLHDKAAAEDATQETLLAALEGIDRFRGEASVKTWLFAILRHKVVDVLRQRGRYVPPPSEDLNAELDVTGFDMLFDEWRHRGLDPRGGGRERFRIDHRLAVTIRARYQPKT